MKQHLIISYTIIFLKILTHIIVEKYGSKNYYSHFYQLITNELGHLLTLGKFRWSHNAISLTLSKPEIDIFTRKPYIS